MSLPGIIVAIIALWLVFGVLGMILHLVKGLLFAALIATVLVLVLGRAGGSGQVDRR
jgi:hypothetical protein